ncbi:winged helix-turn-helix domain-containing protein [Planctomycetota bacterium]
MNKFNPSKFDELVLSRTRLGILALLIGGDKLDFTYIRKALKLSDGNLSVQIRKLEEAELIKVKKIFIERKPKTFCTITPKGRKAIKGLVAELESILKK